MAKLLATETAQEAVDAAIQFHGAGALEQGHPLEHLYRDVRAPRIYEGASEIQREIIARPMFRAAARSEPCTVVVTGGAKGIGRAIVERFAAARRRGHRAGARPGRRWPGCRYGDCDRECDVTDEAR